MQDNALIKIDALNLEASINQPQFKALLDQGWRVAGMLPVDDGGSPFLIFILRPPSPVPEPKSLSLILYFICFQSIILLLLLIKDFI